MQNEAHTSCISSYAKKITLKTGHVMKKNRNTEFISGRMRINSYVFLALLFFYQLIQCIKSREGLKIGIVPFVNVQIIQ